MVLKAKKKQRKQDIIVASIVILLLSVGAAAYFHKELAYFFLGRETDAKFNTINKITRDDIDANKNKPADYNLDNIEPINPDDVLKDQLLKTSANQDDSLNIAGYLAVPQVGIKLSIYYGVTFANLWYGTGTVKANQKMGEGNYVLASHRIDDPNKLFRPLERSNMGDQIYVSDQNYVYEYNIFNIVRVTPDQGQLMDDPKDGETPIITLITCNDTYARKRFVVQGSYAQKWKMNELPDHVKRAFNFTTNQFGS